MDLTSILSMIKSVDHVIKYLDVSESIVANPKELRRELFNLQLMLSRFQDQLENAKPYNHWSYSQGPSIRESLENLSERFKVLQDVVKNIKSKLVSTTLLEILDKASVSEVIERVCESLSIIKKRTTVFYLALEENSPVSSFKTLGSSPSRPKAAWPESVALNKSYLREPDTSMLTAELIHASGYGKLDQVEKLLNQGADVNAGDIYDGSALLTAASQGRYEIAELLINHGADVNAQNARYGTALQAAASRNHYKIAKLLLNAGADVNACGGFYGNALQAAASRNHYEIAELLLNHDADVNSRDKDCCNALHTAIGAQNYEMIKLLLNHGVNVNARDKIGESSLHYAVRTRNTWIIAMLLENGADVELNDEDGRTLLHSVSREADDTRSPLRSFRSLGPVMTQLLQKGANANTADRFNRTPLQDVVQPGHDDDIILMLLKALYQDIVKDDGDVYWEGFESYRKCEGDMSIVLTITRLNPQSHCFIAKSVADFLQEFYPIFGLKLLDWVSVICDDYQIREKNISPKRRKSDYDRSVRELVVQDSKYAAIRGFLQAGILYWTLFANSKEIIKEIKDALTWTLSVLRDQRDGVKGLFCWTFKSLDFGLPEITSFEPAKTESYCWTRLFSYACIAELPLRHHSKSRVEGLEIKFDLLLELAAVDRQLLTKGGPILIGFDTALVPLEPCENRHWHFLLTEGKQITPSRIKRELSAEKGLNGIQFNGDLGVNSNLGGAEIAYVGYCTSALITIGTCDSDRISINDISMSSGVPKADIHEESVERSSGSDVLSVLRIGFLGSSIGPNISKRKDKKFKHIAVVAKRTLESNFENALTSANATPCIMWDQVAQRAWLVPATSVLFFASLRHVKWKGYSFKGKSTEELPGVCYDHSADDIRKPERAIRENQLLLVEKADGVTVNDDISFGNIVKQMWLEMSIGEDVCISDTTGKKYERSGHILGYDLNEAICGGKKVLRGLNVKHSIKCWEPLAQINKTQVVFCRDVGEIVKCASPTIPDNCIMSDCPTGALSCLFQDLRTFYGELWKETPDLAAQEGRLCIPGGYQIIPNAEAVLYNGISMQCSKLLFSVAMTSSQTKKLQKHRKKISLPSARLNAPCCITFGKAQDLIKI